jgi:hypothetical protein
MAIVERPLFLGPPGNAQLDISAGLAIMCWR